MIEQKTVVFTEDEKTYIKTLITPTESISILDLELLLEANLTKETLWLNCSVSLKLEQINQEEDFFSLSNY